MDRTAFLSTAALGIAFIVLYGVRCWRRAAPVDVGVLVNIMLESGGIVAGAFLILSTIVPELKDRLSSLDIYILISGIVVCAVSAKGLKRDVWTEARVAAPNLPLPHPVVAPVIAVAQDGSKVA